jgi:flagellar basal body-associated protein FliL
MAEEQAQEAEVQDGGEAPPPEEPTSRLPQLLVLIAVILIGQAAAAYVLVTHVFMPKVAVEETPEEVAQERPVDRPVVNVEAQLLFDLDDLVLNPPDRFGEIRFLTAKVVLKLDKAEALAELSGLKASKVRDQILMTLGSTTYQSMDNAAERDSLRERLKEAVNASSILEQGEVTAVYFERFILQ